MNAIQLELMRLRLVGAAEEMGVVLQRTALSANIKERRDFSCALFDAAGRLIAQAAHVPVHLGSMSASVSAVLTRLPPLAEGTTAIVNDPYAGGTHLPDITLVSPVFWRGHLIGYAANRAHHADVGGATPGSMTLSRSIDEEGVCIAPNILDAATLARLLQAVRTPEERLGDLLAQQLANAAGAAALRRIAETEGVEGFERGFSSLLHHAEQLTRAVLARVPAGRYEAQDRMDDDGTGDTTNRDTNGNGVAIRLKLSVSHGGLIADFRDSDPQGAGCTNCPAAVTRSAVYYVVGCLLHAMGREDVPINDGCFRTIEVKTRPGTIVHAEHPAAVVAGNTETSQRIVDVMLAALRQALPELIPAESCGTMSSVALGGAGWTYYETIGGGSGAGPTWDGESGVQCHMTNTLNTPAEALEMQYPLRVRRFELRDGSGGEGTHRGGDGIVREIEALADCEGTLLTDRRRFPPGNAKVGRNLLNGRNVGGMAHVTLRPGGVLCVETPGGGGWTAGVEKTTQ